VIFPHRQHTYSYFLGTLCGSGRDEVDELIHAMSKINTAMMENIHVIHIAGFASITC
jgi:hypothetical protein